MAELTTGASAGTEELSTTAERPRMEGVHHFDITVTDVDRSVAWYERIFGFTRVFEEPFVGGFAVVMTEPRSGLFFGVSGHEANRGETFDENRTGMDHISLRVASREELDRWQAWLARNDVRQSPITDAYEPFRHAVLVFRDPDNVQLELFWLGEG